MRGSGEQIDRQTIELSDKVVDGLLYGSLRLNGLDSVDISEISKDVRLGNCYFNSGAGSVQQFLDLKISRFKFRNYGKVSEKKLRQGLIAYLSHHPREVGVPRKSPAEPDAKSIQRKVLRSKIPWTELSEDQWEFFRNKLKGSELRHTHIYPATAQIGAYWPFASRKKANEATVDKYLSYSLKDLRGLHGFGRRKIGSYIACVIHLSQGKSASVAVGEPQTLREEILFAWENTNLAKREKLVIEHRFGIKMRKHTLEELASMLKVTRERVRQIEKKAVFKLRLAIDVKETAVLLFKNRLEIWNSLSASSVIRRSIDLDLLEDQLPFEVHLAIELCADRRHRGIKNAAIGEWLSGAFSNDESNWYREKSNQRIENLNNQANIHAGLSRVLNTL